MKYILYLCLNGIGYTLASLGVLLMLPGLLLFGAGIQAQLLAEHWEEKA